MTFYAGKASRVGFLVNTSSSEVKAALSSKTQSPLLDTLKALQNSFGGAKEITILLAYGKEPLEEKEMLAVKQMLPGINLLGRPCPQGEGVLQGFSFLNDRGAVKLFYVNYDNLAGISSVLPAMSKLVTGKSVATAKWDDGARLTLPQSMYVAEKGISRALTIAIPSLAQDFHFYLGLMGLPSKGWEKIAPELPRLYVKSYSNLQHAGIDSGLLLTSAHIGLSIDNSTKMQIDYPHELPKDRAEVKEYAKSRVNHFRQEMSVIADYLAATGQDGKLALLTQFIAETEKTILKTGFHWSTHRIKQSENPVSGKSSFIKG